MREADASKSSITAIDLFCGAGGASRGMHEAGVQVAAAADWNETALQTHLESLPGEPTLHDLSQIDLDALGVDSNNVDWVHGSPPCKGFSEAQGERTPDDPRNQLVWHYLDWISEVEPRVVTMENVEGLRRVSDTYFEEVLAGLRERGYRVRWAQLNAADYGVPQRRQRVYVLGLREDVPLPDRWFPAPTHAAQPTRTLSGDSLQRWVTAREALADIDGKEVPVDETTRVANHVEKDHSMSARERMAKWEYGFCGASVTKRRLDPERPAPTVTHSDGTPPAHYRGKSPTTDGAVEDVRRLTVRECARLQSFPDDHVFVGSRTAQYRQVGNAVPPRLQEAIARHVTTVLS